MKKSKTKNVLILLTVAFLTIVTLISARLGAESTVDEYITFTSATLQVRKSGTWIDIIKDNEDVSNGQTIDLNDEVRFTLFWHVNPENMSHIEAGSKFSVQLPTNVVDFVDHGNGPLIDSTSSLIIGNWQLVDGVIQVEFNEIVEDLLSIDDGYFIMEGSAIKSGEEKIIIKGIELPSIKITDISDNRKEIPYFEEIVKNGGQVLNDNSIRWTSYINFDNYKNLYENKQIETRANSVFVDDLESGQTINIDKIQITLPLYGLTSESKMSTTQVYNMDLTHKFTKVMDEEGETYDAFYTRVVDSATPTIGVYDNSRVIISFKDLPTVDGTGIKYDNWNNTLSLEENLTNLESMNFIRAFEKAKLLSVLSNANPNTKGDVIAFVVTMVTNVPDDMENKALQNTAYLRYNTTEKQSQPSIVNFSRINGGATGITGKIKLHKIDSETKQSLVGAVFEIYTKEGTLVVSDLVTDDSGYVSYSGLRVGDYYLVEKEAPKGYVLSKQKIEFSLTGLAPYLELQFNNQREEVKVGKVVLTKVDSESNEVLQGAVFDLYHEDGTLYKGDLISDNNGYIVVVDIPFGNYYFKEKLAPTGYDLNDQLLNFTIADTTVVQEVVYKNTKTPPEEPDKPNKPAIDSNKNISAPSTGDDTNYAFLVQVLAVSFAVGAIVMKRKYTKKR